MGDRFPLKTTGEKKTQLTISTPFKGIGCLDRLRWAFGEERGLAADAQRALELRVRKDPNLLGDPKGDGFSAEKKRGSASLFLDWIGGWKAFFFWGGGRFFLSLFFCLGGGTFFAGLLWVYGWFTTGLRMGSPWFTIGLLWVYGRIYYGFVIGLLWVYGWIYYGFTVGLLGSASLWFGLVVWWLRIVFPLQGIGGSWPKTTNAKHPLGNNWGI